MPSQNDSIRLTLAPTIGPWVKQTGLSLSQTLDQLASMGFRAAQLDATLPSLRPRELSTSARRDILSRFKRASVNLAGIDLFIPSKHLLDPQTVGRAVDAITGAIDLSADLGRIPLSLALPVGDPTVLPMLDTLIQQANHVGTKLAIHAEDQLELLQQKIAQSDQSALGMALDPANLIALGLDPALAVHHNAKQLTVARLSDFQTTSGRPLSPTTGSAPRPTAGIRCPVGQGDLDLLSYRLALDMAKTRQGPVVLDLRQMEQVSIASTTALQAWDDAGQIP